MTDPTLRRRLTGVFTALVTPFRDGAFDVPAFRNLIEAQIAGGVEGIVPVGTTGESPTLTHEEHAEVIKVAVETAVAVAPPRPLIGVRVSAFSFNVTDSGLASGVRIVTLSAACVMVNSNGLACPLFGFSGRHVPDRSGGACAARPITTTAAANAIVNTVRFISTP